MIQPAGPASISILDMKSGEERLYRDGPEIPDRRSPGPAGPPTAAPSCSLEERRDDWGSIRSRFRAGEKTLLVSIPPHQFCFLRHMDARRKEHHLSSGQSRADHAARYRRKTGTSSSRRRRLRESRGSAFRPMGNSSLSLRYEPLGSPWKICLVSPAGGPIREIYATKAGEVIQWFQWTPDGRAIWLRKFTRAADEKTKPVTEFLSISPDGRNVRTLDPSLMATGSNSIHPDGRQIAYASGADQGRALGAREFPEIEGRGTRYPDFENGGRDTLPPFGDRESRPRNRGMSVSSPD